MIIVPLVSTLLPSTVAYNPSTSSAATWWRCWTRAAGRLRVDVKGSSRSATALEARTGCRHRPAAGSDAPRL